MTSLPAIQIEGNDVLLPVRAAPGASRDAIAGVHGEALKVSVTAAPEKGKANRAIIKVLAKELDLKRSSISLHAGETSRDKRFRIEGVGKVELQERLEKLSDA